jgi:AraC-like DNA-binding protein
MADTLRLRDLNPVLRGANVMELDNLTFGPRYNYGHQILYVFEGKGEGAVNGKRFDLESGDFFLYGPGDLHSFKNYPPDMLTIGTHYFSFVPVSEQKLAMKNGATRKIDKKYWEFADTRARVEGFPEIPFYLKIPLQKRAYLAALMRNISDSFHRSERNNSLHNKAMLLELFHTVIEASPKTSATGNKIESFENFISENYKDTVLSRKSAARKLGISESYLTALLKNELKTNFTEYLTEFRMRKAMQLILYSKMMVKEICGETGYKDVSYFVHTFKKRHGRAPLSFRING